MLVYGELFLFVAAIAADDALDYIPALSVYLLCATRLGPALPVAGKEVRED